MKPRTLRITAQDIEQGEREECSKCPAALALKRLFPGKRIRVEYGAYRIGRDWFCSPKSLEKFVERFDGGHSMLPTRIKLTFRHD